jgi:hypothetical protein
MFDGQDREADLKNVESLLALVREHVTATGEVQLYPVWDGRQVAEGRDQAWGESAQPREVLLQ